MNFHPRTRCLLRMPIGCAPREIEALNHAPIHTLPEIAMGFGLVGNTGVGKSWALVQQLAGSVDAMVSASPDPMNFKMPLKVRWVNWPEKAEELKRQCVRFADAVDDWCGDVKGAAIVILDDLGRERSKGEDDYATALLNEILDARYRNRLATFWTSNLMPDGLSHFYPAPLVSRLLSAWPPCVIEGDDLRLARFRDGRALAAGVD
jgi:DNA replication protein DnaC